MEEITRIAAKRRAAAVALAVIAGWLIAWAHGAQAAGWSTPTRLSAAGQIATYPEIALDGRRDAVSVWAQLEGNREEIMTSSRLLGGRSRWARPLSLSPDALSADFPQLAVDSAGAAVAAWDAAPTDGPTFIEAAVRRSASAGWGRALRISERGGYVYQPQVAIDRHGVATVVWSASPANAKVTRIEASTFKPETGAWSAPARLASSSDQLLDPQVAADARGDAIAVWKRWVGGGILQPAGTNGTIGAAIKRAGARAWRAAITLGRYVEPMGQGSASFEFPGPHVAMDAHGNAMVVWQGENVRRVLTEVAVWNASQREWHVQPPVSNQFAVWPHIAADSRGDATVVWQAQAGGISVATERIGGCCWTRPRTLTRGSVEAFYPRVAVDPFGDALATWSRSGGAVQVARRDGLGGVWQRPDNVGAQDGGVSELAVDAQRDALVIWQQPVSHPNGILIEVSAYAPR